jgi:hypothetical protein
MSEEERRAIAEEARRALIAVAVAAYEDAGFQGLCVEGRWEAALGAMRSLDLTLPPPNPDGTATRPL